MSPCCGTQRNKMKPPRSELPTDHHVLSSGLTQAKFGKAVNGPSKRIPLRYLGKSKFVVLGPITHQRYVFYGANAVLEIDHRDAALMVRLKQLAKV